jgi:hypothetical protein
LAVQEIQSLVQIQREQQSRHSAIVIFISSSTMSGSTSLTARHKGSSTVTDQGMMILQAAAEEDDGKEKEEKIRSGHDTNLRRLMLYFLAVAVLVGTLILLESKYEETTTATTMTTTTVTNSKEHLPPPQILLQAKDFEEEPPPKTEEADAKVKQQQPKQIVSNDVEGQLVSRVMDLEAKVRRRKALPGTFMEVDPEGIILTTELQAATRQLLVQRYGKQTVPYRVKVDLTFPSAALVPNTKKHSGHAGNFVIELAPIELLPVSVFYFLEMARTWKKGAFHRNAAHVLQVWTESIAHGQDTTMPFQEYSVEFPHVKGVTGYAGRYVDYVHYVCWWVCRFIGIHFLQTIKLARTMFQNKRRNVTKKRRGRLSFFFGIRRILFLISYNSPCLSFFFFFFFFSTVIPQPLLQHLILIINLDLRVLNGM